MKQMWLVLGHAFDTLAPTRFAADFMQAVGAARPARNPHAAQKAIGDALLRYTSQARCFLTGMLRCWLCTVWAGASPRSVLTLRQQPCVNNPWSL